MTFAAFSDFTKLQEQTQEELLSRSTPLYVQCLLGFYFTTELGQEELLSVLQLGACCDLFDDFKGFNETVRLFADPADLDFFERLLSKLKLLKLESVDCRATIAAILLFDRETLRQSDVDNSFLLILNDVMFDSCLVDPEVQFGCDEFILILKSMAVFFAVSADLGGNSKFHKYIFIEYTREEEAWLQNQCRLLDEAYRSVTLGQDFIRDFIVHSEGKPLPPDSIVLSKVPFCERVLRILNFHSEFQTLDRRHQEEYLMFNGIAAMALIVARNELLGDGIEQLQVRSYQQPLFTIAAIKTIDTVNMFVL